VKQLKKKTKNFFERKKIQIKLYTARFAVLIENKNLLLIEGSADAPGEKTLIFSQVPEFSKCFPQKN
jgi:hypothetical protein